MAMQHFFCEWEQFPSIKRSVAICTWEAEQMRHDTDRYRMLLETEKNPRVRRVLTNMIQELESRVLPSGAPESNESSNNDSEELSAR
jgi:hypothetical protein